MVHLLFQENVLLRKDLESKEDDKKGNVDIPLIHVVPFSLDKVMNI